MPDWFFSLFDRIAQSVIWQSVLSHFQWIDWFALVLFVVGVIYGLKSGLLSELAELLGAVIVIYVAHEFDDRLTGLVLRFVQVPQETIAPMSFILVAVSAWFGLVFIAKYFKKFFHAKTAAPLSILGGGLMGGLHVIVLLSIVCHAIILLPLPSLHKTFEPGNSYSGDFLAQLTPRIHRVINRSIQSLRGKVG